MRLHTGRKRPHGVGSDFRRPQVEHLLVECVRVALDEEEQLNLAAGGGVSASIPPRTQSSLRSTVIGKSTFPYSDCL